jgi:DNA-directed RNA polymerase subunit omega
VSAPHRVAEGITNPPIDALLEKADSKYALVIYAAKRARQINAYYSELGDGLLEYVGPLVSTHPQEKALSIALREIDEGLLTMEPVGPEPATPGGLSDALLTEAFLTDAAVPDVAPSDEPVADADVESDPA